ncbi:alpha-amylase [Luteolibacter sp. AS25]
MSVHFFTYRMHAASAEKNLSLIFMNSTMIQFFHWYTPGESFLWDHAADQAEYLANLGITAAWLPPAYKGASGSFSTGYDPYDLFDLGEFDQKGVVPTKYGSRDQFLNACKTLQKNGIGVIVDVVLNHKGGGDEKEKFQVVKVDPEHRDRGITEPYEIESYTKFTFPGRGEKYSTFKWDFTCFTGVDHAENEDGYNIYRIINDYGDNWDEMISCEKGNFDFLMLNDLETRNPYVRGELNYWGEWFHEQCHFDGVRLDAVKHMTPDFYKEWLQVLRSNTGKNVFAVGEYWAPGDLELLERYLDAVDGSMTLFDSSLHHNLHNASEAGEVFDLRTILDNSLMMSNPTAAVTLVENHDTQPLQALEAPVAAWFKPLAYALILLRAEGYPCVFHPDLYGAKYKDTGNDGEEYEIEIMKVGCLENLLKARKDFAYGHQNVYFDDPHCIGFTRLGDEDHAGCAVIMSNQGDFTKRMEMGTDYSGKKFHDILGHVEGEIAIGEDGWAEFKCPAGSVSVWVPN